ncbi:MAG TPA: peptide chain release factor N(5)-glutamine methyltransferase [bacterium]
MTTAGTSVRTAVAGGAERLSAAGAASPEREAEALLAAQLGSGRLELYLRDAPVDEAALAAYAEALERRSSGMPLQYLLGEAEFFGRRFTVRPGVFIPRPETEAVVAEAIGALARSVRPPRRVLDAGTGSGCIAVTLAAAFPACTVVAVEVSYEALQAASANLARHEAASRVALVQGNWLDAIRGRFDGLVANPPYLPSATIAGLPADVRREPRLALDGGPDGTDALAALTDTLPRVLNPGGVAVFECGESQAVTLAVRARARAGVAEARYIRDLAGRPRGVVVRMAGGRADS